MNEVLAAAEATETRTATSIADIVDAALITDPDGVPEADIGTAPTESAQPFIQAPDTGADL